METQASPFHTDVEAVLTNLFAAPMQELVDASAAFSAFVARQLDTPMDPADPWDLPF